VSKLAEEILKEAKERIAEAEKNLKEMRRLIRVLKRTRVDVSQQEAKAKDLEMKINLWKKALEEEGLL